jgi:Tfp pilus assembly protein PilN
LLEATGRLTQPEREAASRRAVYIDPWEDARVAEIKRAQPSLDVRPVPSVNGVGSISLAAYGAALAAGSPIDGGLVPASALHKLRVQRRKPRFVAAAACLAALAFAVGSADYSRTRTERALDAQLRALSDRASSTLALETETRRLAQEEQALARAQRERPQQLATLLAVSVRLPADAHIQMLRATGREWQLDGVAVNAARLIPALEAHESLEGVRFLEATRRADRRGEIRENFSLALRAVRSP